MQRILISTLAIAGIALAAGCGGGGGGGNDNDDNNVMQPLGNSIQAVANQGPDDASLAVTDPNALTQSIVGVFGQPDNESTTIGDNQTLRDVVN